MCVGEGCVTIGLNINKKPTRGMIDSGASKSVMDIGTLETLGIKHPYESDQNICLYDASNNKMEMSGCCNVEIHIPEINKSFFHEFNILNVKTYKTILLGRDFLETVGPVTIDIPKRRIKIGNKWINGEKHNNRFRVNCSESITLPARSEQTIPVKSKIDSAMLEFEFSPKFTGVKGVYLTRARVQPDINGRFAISILNVNEHDVKLTCRTRLGEIYPSTDGNHPNINSPIVDDILGKIKIGINLSEEQHSRITEVIRRNADVFAKNPKKPNITATIEHPIETGDAFPTYAKPRRLPNAWKNEIHENIQEMVDNGIIRPSKSPWNCPIILVRKKGKTRFVCDYRDLNKVTKKDTYPLPNIKDCIENMEGTNYWSTMDAASAYWAVNVKESDREKTAFSIPNGKYEFKVMPFGLCNAGATYQRLIDICLSGLPSDRIIAYLDDIVIFSKTYEEHLSDIEKVFARLRTSNVSLRAEKCSFGCSQIEFLGYHLSTEGIKPRNELIDAIVNFSQPKTKKEVKRFLGTVGFYRNFIHHFSEISEPLRNLTNDNSNFQWNLNCEKSFTALKQCISQHPILAFPITNKEFIIEVDASDKAIGGILSQEQSDGHIKPVGYFSFSLSAQQQKWETFSKEVYALVAAVRQWHVYLYGNKFKVLSDHNPLLTIRNKKDPRGKVARWLMELQEYNFDISHIPGKQNQKADFLSRIVTANIPPTGRLEENVYRVTKENFHEQLRDEQNRDQVIQKAVHELLNTGRVTQGRLKRVGRHLRLEHHILTKSGRPIIPASMYQYIISEYHQGGDIKSHFGIEKTYETIKSRFYWPNMYHHIQNYIASCHICQQCKTNSQKPKAPLIPLIAPDKPMQFICIDIAYLEEDPDGYKYILLIGCVFSKFIAAIPLKDQTATVIIDAICKKWIYTHGSPKYMLSDQGSNVDGETIRTICEKLHIEKRRTSGYHAQGNGFAERSIRNVREVLRTALLHKQLLQSFWKSILDSVVFALNTSHSQATNCTPFEVVFGRKPTLPMDVYFDTKANYISDTSPTEYLKDIKVQLFETIDHVAKFLGIAREKMAKQYNKTLKTHKLVINDRVWLERRSFRSHENKKLSPRKTGPWTIMKVYPNGVNFRIKEDSSGRTKVVHHNKLTPVKDTPQNERTLPLPESDDSSLSSALSSLEGSDNEDGSRERRYPVRNRTRRTVPGTVSWDVLDARTLSH